MDLSRNPPQNFVGAAACETESYVEGTLEGAHEILAELDPLDVDEG